MDLILAKKRVLLLVSGGIAIYKSLDLISNLKKEGAEVFVVMSEEATRFIAPLTFEAMSGNKVLCRATESFPQISHISYANLADIAIIAPATINTIAKLNYGIADNLIVETLLACKCEVFIAPSANVNMLESPQNRANLNALKNMGYKIIPPRVSRLACDIVANGAMAEVGEIIFQLKRAFVENSSLGAPCGDFGNLGRFADAPVQSHAPNSQKTPQLPPQILELDSSKSDSHKYNESSLRGKSMDSPKQSKQNKSARSANPIKSFCYFWLSPKVESPLPLNPNQPSKADSYKTINDLPNFWHNKNIVITGGGSVESIDSIRHISNDSSGKQASNLALAFYYLGANVSLIASKFPIALPLGVEKIAVKSSADFKNAVESKLNTLQESKKNVPRGSIFDEKSGLCSHEQGNKTKASIDEASGKLHDLSQKDNAQNVLLMAAAISDFVPKECVKGKLKKEQIGKSWDLHLTQNDDILQQISSKFGDSCYIVGFKAESFGEQITQEAIKTANQNAKKMLKNKNCDMVVLNIISQNNEIGGERNEVRIFTAQDELKIPQDSKLNISFEIAKNIAQNLSKK